MAAAASPVGTRRCFSRRAPSKVRTHSCVFICVFSTFVVIIPGDACPMLVIMIVIMIGMLGFPGDDLAVSLSSGTYEKG